MLEQILVATIEVRDRHVYQGRERVEASLASEDGQTLYIYEGQMKDLGKTPPILEKGKKYKVSFRPFMNNHWVEVKLVKIEPA
jgi:hypothetical protein